MNSYTQLKRIIQKITILHIEAIPLYKSETLNNQTNSNTEKTGKCNTEEGVLEPTAEYKFNSIVDQLLQFF